MGNNERASSKVRESPFWPRFSTLLQKYGLPWSRKRVGNVDYTKEGSGDATSVIFGITRFSVITELGFKNFKATQGKDLAAVQKIIHDEDRLNARFRYFEKHLLASLDAQTDKNFSHWLIASSVMPDKFKERLESLVSDRSYLNIFYMKPSESMGPVFRQICARAIPATAKIAVSYRIDDDDGLAIDYIKRLRDVARHEFLGMYYSCGRGFYVSEDPRLSILPARLPNSSAGLAFISSATKTKTVYETNVSHLLVDRKLPCILNSQRPGWIMAAHGHTDTKHRSRMDFAQGGLPKEDDEIRAFFPWLLDNNPD